MPVFKFTSPDGKTYKVKGPEGSTKEEAFEILQSQLKPAPKMDLVQREQDYGSVRSEGLQGVLEDIGGGMTDIAQGVKQRIGLADEQDVERKRELDKHLSTPGKMVGQMAALAPLALAAPATMGGAVASGAAMGGLMPTGEDESVVKNMAFGAAGGAVGQKIGQAMGNYAAKTATSRGTAKALGETHDKLIDRAVAHGYKLDPTDTNPTFMNKMGKRAGGNAAIDQRISTQNQQITNQLVREDMGIVADIPITPDVLSEIRKVAAKAFGNVSKEIRKYGGRFETDQIYRKEIKQAFAPYKKMRQEFGDAVKNKGLDDVYSVLMRKDVDIDTTMELVKKLRKDASTFYAKSDDPDKLRIAKISRAAANSLEDMIERKVKALGRPKLVKKWKKARKLMAKTYSVEDALDPVGDINAHVLGRALKKGAPLDGNLKTIAEVANTWPTATKLMTRGAETGAMDAPFAIGGAAMGEPLLAAYGMSRPGIRAAFTGPLQRGVKPQHGPSLLERGGRALGANQGLLGRITGPVVANQ